MPERANASASIPYPSELAESQPEYWETWMSLAQQIMVQAGESTGHASPETLAETLRKGWETVAPIDSQSGPVMIDKFIPQTLIYVVFSEQALKIIQIIQDAPDDADWREGLQRGFATIRNTFFQLF
jgi:hypothetical protein